MSAYAIVDAEGVALYQDGMFDPASLDGPPTQPPDVGEHTAHLMLTPIDWRAQPTPTSVLLWNDGAPEWEERGVLEELKAAAIAKTYPDVDAVYDAAIGRRVTVYKRAEDAARAYMAAEVKPNPVSELITGHARSNPTGVQQTDEWAAQQIIERADAFLWAEVQMRNVMFDRQVDMRAATTPDELAAAVASWNGFIAWLRDVLELPLASN